MTPSPKIVLVNLSLFRKGRYPTLQEHISKNVKAEDANSELISSTQNIGNVEVTPSKQNALSKGDALAKVTDYPSGADVSL